MLVASFDPHSDVLFTIFAPTIRVEYATVIGSLSRFTCNPGQEYWNAIISEVFKYLKGTMVYGLNYKGHPTVLESYSDGSWIVRNSNQIHKSIDPYN